MIETEARRAGPDQLAPAEDFSTWKPEGCVRLRIPEHGKAIETTQPISVPGLLKRAATQYPNRTALAYKTQERWETITYKEYEKMVQVCAKAFISLGLKRYHTVCIIGYNSPEWVISNLAAIYAGGICCGIYTTNSPEACLHCIETSRTNIIVVQDEKQLEKIMAIKDKITDLKAIIQYEGNPLDPDVLSWKRLMELGALEDDDKLDNILETICINECCTLVFTSGTINNPKAVMLSHDNLTWDALAISEWVRLDLGQEVLVSYLPLSHVAAQIVDIYIALTVVASVYIADKDALKGTLLKTLQEVQPTRFLGVPRVWEKIYEKMSQIGAQNGPIKKTIAMWAKTHGLQHNLDKMNGLNTKTWSYTIANAFVFKKIRQALGFGRCTTFISAAAPISPEVKKYFLSIDLMLLDAYGLSEASGAHTVGLEGNFHLDSIGPTMSGMKTKIHEPDEVGTGEVCLYGRHVFMGYLNDERQTREALDDEGWLYSGDIGNINEKGLIFITGRIKEIIVTSGGENIPPVLIEQLIKFYLPHLSNVIAIGERKKFLSALLTLKTELNEENGKPSDVLTAEVKEWLETLGCPANTVGEVLQAGPHQNLLRAIQEGIDKVNQRATSNAQKIQKVALLPNDFSVAGGEFGPTMKLKRSIVTEKYGSIIDKLYHID